MRQIIYVKYNRTRSEKFQLKTAIVRENGALSVEKTALTEAGAGHMGSFWEKYQMIREQNPRIRFLEPEFKDGGKTVCFRYLEGETLAELQKINPNYQEDGSLIFEDSHTIGLLLEAIAEDESSGMNYLCETVEGGPHCTIRTEKEAGVGGLLIKNRITPEIAELFTGIPMNNGK